MCNIVVEKYPDTTDLYSEMGEITRCSKVIKHFFIIRKKNKKKKIFLGGF